MSGPASIIVPALKRHTATLIVAHGLGDSGAGWVFLAENFRRLNKFEEVRFVFPHAPNIPITINSGVKMQGWHDIISLDAIGSGSDEVGIARSQKFFHDLIDEEVAQGIPSHRIVLGGFSQGGAMSLFSGLTCPHKLGGIFGLSSYLLLQHKIQAKIAAAGDANKETKIFMGHGDKDEVVKYEFGKQTAEKLREWGYNVELKTYRGLAHSADLKEIDDLEGYLNSIIPPLGDETQKKL